MITCWQQTKTDDRIDDVDAIAKCVCRNSKQTETHQRKKYVKNLLLAFLFYPICSEICQNEQHAFGCQEKTMKKKR